ncbi:MAG: hypothetical protein R3B96_17030 [Pirellulaceae bacterium]
MRWRLVILLLALWCGLASDAWARKWFDIYGNEMEGTFVSYDSDSEEVTISNQSGRTNSYQFSLFSQADQQYVVDELRKRGETDLPTVIDSSDPRRAGGTSSSSASAPSSAVQGQVGPGSSPFGPTRVGRPGFGPSGIPTPGIPTPGIPTPSGFGPSGPSGSPFPGGIPRPSGFPGSSGIPRPSGIPTPGSSGFPGTFPDPGSGLADAMREAEATMRADVEEMRRDAQQRQQELLDRNRAIPQPTTGSSSSRFPSSGSSTRSSFPSSPIVIPSSAQGSSVTVQQPTSSRVRLEPNRHLVGWHGLLRIRTGRDGRYRDRCLLVLSKRKKKYNAKPMRYR